jgi:hypothetical protein
VVLTKRFGGVLEEGEIWAPSGIGTTGISEEESQYNVMKFFFVASIGPGTGTDGGARHAALVYGTIARIAA